MSSGSNQTEGGANTLRILGWVAAGLDLAIAAAEIIFTKEGGGGFVRAAVLIVAAACVVGGIHLLERRPWPGAVIASVGAMLGAVSLIWILIPVPLGIVIVMKSLAKARLLSSLPVEAVASAQSK